MICRAAACLTLCLILWIADCDAQTETVGTVTIIVVVLRVKIAPRGELSVFVFPLCFLPKSAGRACRLVRVRTTTRACVTAQRKCKAQLNYRALR